MSFRGTSAQLWGTILHFYPIDCLGEEVMSEFCFSLCQSINQSINQSSNLLVISSHVFLLSLACLYEQLGLMNVPETF